MTTMVRPRLVLPEGAPRDQWLAERANGIGSSDIAVLAGLSRYGSPYTLWVDKVSPARDVEPTDGPMYWGTVLEGPIATDFARRNNLRVERTGTWAHGEADWARANPDRLVHDDDADAPTPAGALEVKTASAYLAKEWAGEGRPGVDDDAEVFVPEQYIVQLQWQLGVCGLDRGWIAGLVGGQWYHQVAYDFDPDLFGDLMALAERFWCENVLDGEPPEVDANPATTRLLKAIKANPGETVLLDPAVLDPLLAARAAAKAVAKDAKEIADGYDNRLRALAGTAEIAMALGGEDERVLFTFKQSAKPSYVVAARTERRLHVPASTTKRKKAA